MRNRLVVLSVHVQPRAKKTEIAGWHGDAIKVRVQAPPVEGAANAALLAFLADALDLPRSRVTLRAGATSRRKRVAVRAPLSHREILQRLGLDP